MGFWDKEKSLTRAEPYELHKFWTDEEDIWTYADAPADIEYNGFIYEARYITGGGIEAGTNAMRSRTIVRCNWDLPFAWQYTVTPPNGIVHYHRYRGHGDDVQLIFVGDVINVEFKQESRQGQRYAVITIEPPKASLNRMGLIQRYSRQCTVDLYSGQCGVNPLLFVKSGELDSISGNVLTDTIFGTEDDGWWKGGEILINGHQSKIIDHSGNDITILPYIYGIEEGMSFEVWPGCDHLKATCDDKFDNLVNMKAMPNIPSRSPWSSESIRG